MNVQFVDRILKQVVSIWFLNVDIVFMRNVWWIGWRSKTHVQLVVVKWYRMISDVRLFNFSINDIDIDWINPNIYNFNCIIQIWTTKMITIDPWIPFKTIILICLSTPKMHKSKSNSFFIQSQEFRKHCTHQIRTQHLQKSKRTNKKTIHRTRKSLWSLRRNHLFHQCRRKWHHHLLHC